MQRSKSQFRRDASGPPLETHAHSLFHKARFAAAAETYLELLGHFPERLDLEARLGYLDLLANRLDSAVSRLTRVLEGGFRRREVLSHLAEAYYRQGNLGPAALCYQQLGREGLAGTLAVLAQLDVMRPEVLQHPVVVDWLVEQPLPVLPATINGREANLVIDTGAGDTVLDTRFAVSAGVRLGGQEWRDFAGGRPAQITHGHAALLQLGAVAVHDVPVQVMDVTATFAEWFPGLPIHGILGVRMLSLFHCTLDYAQQRLRLAPAGSRPAPLRSAPMWMGPDGMLLTQVDFPGLREALVFLDSGMTGAAFAVAQARAPALGIQAEEGCTLVGMGGGGEVQGDMAKARHLVLDRVTRQNVRGTLLKHLSLESALGFRINGLIGHELLRDACLTLDFACMRLQLQSGETADGD